MTPMMQHLIARVQASGPMTVAEFMTEALLHPTHGYYTTRDPLGATGDFTTSPEISQMFGEMIGLALAQSWLDQGAPAPFTLAEPGPGRGTLMADILRATRAVPGFHDAMQLCLIEASPTLRASQQELLGTTPTWLHDLEQLPDQPLLLIANEFFDALPIHQFLRGATGWRERLVGVRDNALTIGLGPEQPRADLDYRLTDTIKGNIVETCPAAPALIQGIADRIQTHGGAALIIDYGDWRSNGDTLQALRHHTPVDPLSDPGNADLTAHIDFEALARAVTSAAGCAHAPLTTQGAFLERLGITARAQALAQNLSGEALQSHIAAHRRLTHPSEMGNLFKVLALFPKGAPPPPGCDP